jgi:aspartokinase
VGNGDQPESTKRHQVERYLAALDPAERDRLASLGPRAAAREVTAALTDQGTAVSERYVAQILDEQTAPRRGSGARRRSRR